MKIVNLEALVYNIQQSLKILMQQSHDDNHEHNYQTRAGQLTLENHSYHIVIKLEHEEPKIEIDTDRESLFDEFLNVNLS